MKILLGEEEPTSGEINKKKDISLSFLAHVLSLKNTIYDEILHVFDDLRRTEKTTASNGVGDGEKFDEDLDKLMADYDRFIENFRQAGQLQFIIRAILNGFKFDNYVADEKLLSLVSKYPSGTG